MKNSGTQEKKIFENVSSVNDALIDLETKMFDQGAKGKLTEAQAILKAQDYNQNKKIYSEAVKNSLKANRRLSDTLKNKFLILDFYSILLLCFPYLDSVRQSSLSSGCPRV